MPQWSAEDVARALFEENCVPVGNLLRMEYICMSNYFNLLYMVGKQSLGKAVAHKGDWKVIVFAADTNNTHC
jgi:hypothetical protein